MDSSALAAVRRDPYVEFVEPIVENFRTTELPSSAIVRSRSALTSEIVPAGLIQIGAPGAWAYTTGGGARLLIIDTGYDRGHPDLPNTPLGNCTHGQFGGCDDGLPKPHGTRATGVITARQDGAGVVGVAPGISVLDTYHWGACDSSNGNCQPPEVASALNWAANTLGARGVINMSLATSTDYGSISMAVSAAYGADHVLVAAMGNDGVQRTNYPAAYSSVLAVGAVNPGGIFPNPDVDYCFAGYPGPTWGSHIDVVGPWYIGDAVNPGGYIQNYCGGTSMAAASVSGTAALIRSRNFSWPFSVVVQKALAST